MTRSSQDIEREVEAARGDLDRTVEALKDKMTPGQLVDELTRSFKGGGAGEMLGNLGAQARENPMALAMIGAGMAWLMMGKSEHHAADGPARAYQTNAAPGAGADSAGVGGAAQTASHVKAKAAEVAGGVKDTVTGAAEHAAHSLHDLGGQASAAGHKAVRSFEDMLQQEPLIVGALGLAAGVALGAVFPSTAAEDRTFGAARDDLVKAGERKMHDAAQSLSASAQAAVEAARSEADRQGFSDGDVQGARSVEVKSVVGSAVEATRDEFGARGPT